MFPQTTIYNIHTLRDENKKNCILTLHYADRRKYVKTRVTFAMDSVSLVPCPEVGDPRMSYFPIPANPLNQWFPVVLKAGKKTKKNKTVIFKGKLLIIKVN